MIRLSHIERKQIAFFKKRQRERRQRKDERKEGGREEKRESRVGEERKIINICLASALLEGEGMAFTSKVFHNFKKTLKGKLLIRGSREGKILHIINGKHTKMYLY